MICLMRELHRSVEQERICLLHLDSAPTLPPLSFCPGILGMNGCQFGFGSSALRGKIESGGGLCVSLPVETRARNSAPLTKPQLAAMQHYIYGRGVGKY